MLLFAIRDEDSRADVEAALGVRFEARDSLTIGDHWLAKLPASVASLRIRSNRDPLWRPGDDPDDRFAFPAHSEHQLVMEVDGETPDVSEKLRRLPSLQLLG
jgi:hypothetical protein